MVLDIASAGLGTKMNQMDLGRNGLALYKASRLAPFRDETAPKGLSQMPPLISKNEKKGPNKNPVYSSGME